MTDDTSTASEPPRRAQLLEDITHGYWDYIAKQGDPIPTGIACLDNALGGGFRPGRLIALLGGPGSGKTALANQIADHVACLSRPVLYLSLEEPRAVLLSKTISRIGNLDYGAVLRGSEAIPGQIDQMLELLRTRESAGYLAYLEGDQRISVEECYREAQYLFAERGDKGLIVVDYFQQWARSIRSAGTDRRELREAVTDLAERLRQMALTLNCTVLMLVSQNRASGYGTANTMTSAKESGDIEYTCDVLMAIDEDKQRTAAPGWTAYTLDIAKNRLGNKGAFPLEWRGNRQHMRDGQAAKAHTGPTGDNSLDEITTRRGRTSAKKKGAA